MTTRKVVRKAPAVKVAAATQEITAELLETLPLRPGMAIRLEEVDDQHVPKTVEGILADATLPPSHNTYTPPRRGSLSVMGEGGKIYACDFGWQSDYYKPYGESYKNASYSYRKAYILPSGPLPTPGKKEWISSLQYPHVLVGSDPEIFALDALGRVIPAWQWLQSKKENSNVFWDGFQAEFTTSAGGCLDGHCSYIETALQRLTRKLHEKFPQATLAPISLVELSEAELESCSDEQVGLGCAPSLSAYGEPQLVVENPRQLPIRFAGGHMHFGLHGDGYKRPRGFLEGLMPGVVKTMDAIGGLAGVSLAAQWDDRRRRQFYGRAGEYRLPKHGLEYRVHSNFWLRDPRLHYLLWDLTRWALRVGWNGLGPLWHAEEEEVRFAINETNVPLAREILRRNTDMLSGFLAQRYGQQTVKYTLSVLLDGVEVIPTKGGDLLKAWGANQNWNMRWFKHASRQPSK